MNICHVDAAAPKWMHFKLEVTCGDWGSAPTIFMMMQKWEIYAAINLCDEYSRIPIVVPT